MSSTIEAAESLVNRAEILPLLGVEIQRAGEWVMAFCPAHSDGQKHNGKSGRSLGLSDRGVLKCFAGCTFEVIMKELTHGRPLQKTNVVTLPQKRSNEKVTAIYQFRDLATGAVVAEKARIEYEEGKRFMWRLPGTVGWPTKDNGGGLQNIHIHDVPLYGTESITPEVLGRNDWIIVCEGEKTCDALHKAGFAAVSGGWGASQTVFGVDTWVALRGKNVALWPDNDEPGRKYMGVVARELRNVATKLVVLNPPVPHKGDAYDYFAAGGQAADLFKNILTSPTLDVLSQSDFRVRIPTDKGILTVEIHDIMRGHGTLEGEMTFSLDGSGVEPFAQRTNILSASTREMLVRSLGGQFGKDMDPNWTVLVSVAYSRIRQGYDQVTASIAEDVDGDDTILPVSYLLEPYIARETGVILFGPPGKGKSWTALLMAVSVNHGVSKLWPVKHPARALYINLERSKESFKRRIGQVNKVLGLPVDARLLMINKKGASLADVMGGTRAAIAQYGIELVVLDSMSRSGMGDLNGNETGNRVADALNSLGVAWIAIGHAPRADDTHLFGSVMFDAAADVVINLVTEQAPGQTTLGVGLKVPKANDMAIPAMSKFAYEFDMLGLSAVRPALTNEFMEVEDREALSPRDSVRRFLYANGEATATEIAVALARSVSYVARILREPNSPFIQTRQVGRDKFYAVGVQPGYSAPNPAGPSLGQRDKAEREQWWNT